MYDATRLAFALIGVDPGIMISQVHLSAWPTAFGRLVPINRNDVRRSSARNTAVDAGEDGPGWNAVTCGQNWKENFRT